MNSFTTKSLHDLVVASVLTLLLMPVIGCSRSADGGDSEAVDTDMPPIHVEQTLVLMTDGEPLVERGYRQHLQVCLDDGGLVTTPLAEDDVKKLGRTYYQLWFDAKRTAWQRDIWDFAVGRDPFDGCRFRMTHESVLTVHSAHQLLSIDLIAGTAVAEPDEGFMPGSGEGMPDDDQLDEGMAKLGYQRLGEAMDAGHRCLRWRDPSGTESCTWSEGRRWGFTRSERGNQAVSYNPGDIVLWVHPADGFGFELTTQKMTVGGQPFDEAQFLPPSGVTVETRGEQP